MMWKLLILSVLGLTGVCVGQIVQNGQCDNEITLQNNFTIDAFLGTWYEYAISDHALGGDCSTIEFTSVENTIAVYHKTVRQNFFEDYNGTASVQEGTARLSLNIPQISSDPIDFWVMNTDYEHYALVYGCRQLSATQREIYIWQLGREEQFEFEMMPVLMNNTMVNTLGISVEDLRYIDHSEQACYELPTIEFGQPVILPGSCDDNITVVQNFDAGRFLGVWHEISSYYSENALGSCSRAQYGSENGSVVDVVNSQVINQTLFTIEGYATVIGEGKLNVVLEVIPGVFAESELLIIATDYNQWAISYTCNNIGDNQRRVFSWIASRTRQLPASAQAEVDDVVSSILDLNPQYYEPTDQSNTGCFYIPEPSDEPAVFGGQCDLNIPVVQNFNAAEYLGLWHDIESYPTPFQFGTCANAYYSLGDDGVDVFNTQVVNETLNTINGLAVPVGNEGKLVVSFPIEGTNLTTETDYWILNTNYNSYSLVYSCRNINDYQQQITVWKLSRSKSLNAEAVTAINNALATQAVLDQRFFIPMDQSPEGCFYYPEPTGEPVLFPGVCEDVPIVTDFNANEFQGTWYEVEAYPKDFQPGQCVTHQFTSANNAINLVSTSVDDQLQTVSSGQLTPIAGNNASFTLTVGNQSFPYYIVDTDYDNYALAYSCVNRGDDFRAVYSWKLSRERQLSNSSITAIDEAMEGITTLENQYFVPVDQTPDACFYFPDLEPGEPVILPGVCDTDIPFVTDFDAAAYLGLWHLIESYPSDNQTGDCNQANYDLADDGTVIVYNTEVVNQTFVEATGSGVLSVEGNRTLGKLYVTFPGAPQPFELYILDTDYTSYSLVYGCVNINTEERRVWSWKMSRNTSLSTEANDAIDAVINNVTVLNQRYYEPVDHSDAACFYYPELVDGQTVVFRGQCNENLPVVMDFDPEGYMGLWHDIERYPAPFQDGTCGNAFYTLDTVQGIVDVYNTQVLNRSLDTINGFAELDQIDANDTSAKLMVTFPVQGFNLTSPYWILATDYDSYALVYSCSNLGSGRRSVTSWKLSRTKSLSPTAITAMNAVINTIDVLDDRYYITQDQTPEGCFYFPEPQTGVPVVFPGQCDLDLDVVQGFSMAQFEGVWHEIEAYPKIEQDGQCINHSFTLNGTDVLDLQSFNVIAMSLGITAGSVSFSLGNNTDGRLSLVFNSNGTDIEIPYWIIDTDYSNYAVVLSCVNQNDDFRGVWSWKLSRIRELSTNSSNAINDAIANIDILDNVYYEPIDQSDEACFYLPEYTGRPVDFPGQCDTNITGIPNFNATGYLGFWRLIESYPTEFQLGTCGDATYSVGENGTVVVFNTEVINQNLSTIEGFAVPSEDGTGKLLVTFPGAPVPAEYLILATDYDNYALVYSCFNINTERRRVYSWKLSRTNTLSQEAITEINAVVDSINVLDELYYETIDRSDAACFYYPDLVEDATVVFRGQCNENLPVVMEFDPAGYMGLWHDIERYPAPFQDGTCGNAFYSLDAVRGEVDVYNTQVLNRTLDTISGTAVLDQIDANDTSAKLLVTFPVHGFNLTTPYWILATDYDSYALVYSCSNLGSERRSVTSWKLSRTKTLSPTAITAMNAVINTIDVLDDRYYIAQDQSPEGCFYFPEPETGVPVVFPGQCDLNLDVVQGFSMDQFQGTWHEIEAYPKEEQPGECISHEFTLNAASTSLNLQSSNVVAQSLGITTGSLTFSSNDQSARLNLAFTSNGTTITIPYWIIDTDYSNYAIAYSCVNQDSDYRGVWTWKLSRTKELSATSIAAINNATANVDILDDRYYESISQSEDSCFYLPDLSLGEPVIFPGQCDPNITVVTNFDAARYLGRWRLIQTYHSDFQNGTCGDATYSPGEGETVVVHNTEVINEALSTIDGSAILATNDGRGILTVTFPNAPPIDYYILDTDYDNYALVYSCFNINTEQRRVFSWKLSRNNTLSQEAIDAINAVVDNVNVLNERYYQSVDRSDSACFYFPEPDGTPVIFRGQCDENITVISEFDAESYMGLWHNIESYPAPFQDGSCGEARYTLNPETLVVYVENTQVVNRGLGPVLDTQTGTAVLDGDGKLLVTFEVNGVSMTTNYWVLDTDYSNFSLVYSCQNIDEERRQVNSWKLSRAKTLNAASASAISAAINQVQVLEERYFEDGRQSEENCFFYPDNEGGDVLLDGQCLDDSLVPVMTGFNANLFTGPWREVARFPSDLQEGECSDAQYTVGAQNTVTITLTEVKDEVQITNEITGTLSTDGRGVITVEGDQVPFNTIYILDTDYNEYALLYGCRNTNTSMKQVYSWKLSRSRSGLSATAEERINDLVYQNVDLFEGYYSYTSQTNDACFHYPKYDELPETIELFGPCNENIRGIPNFDAEAYLGRWIEIERYPQRDQFGTCDRAYYSPGDDGVLVRNTQVVNETLAEQLGFAVVASDDNSGILDVTFVVNGITVNANYYVLATDYSTYALVYSCRNLENGNRQVSSWKLSRTTSLSPQAIASIDAVIAQTQGLFQDYYRTTSQSDEDCFYVPEVDVNAAPLFRGQCEDIVRDLDHFDVLRFEGWWHEIERFPVNNYRGECISSRYQIVPAGYEVVDTAVLNGTGQVDSGTVQVYTTGMLRRTINGVVQDIWVLETDYTNYALLYSCENVGDEYRRVWSAKHSRTSSLDQVSETAMQPEIDSNRVLYDQFYLPVDQSDAACFHYPEQTGQVILRGQCDDNIPVKQEFDVSAYAGTWYQIERYPQLHEDPASTCIGARYILDDASGVVRVINWEVVDGVLETIEGTATVVSSDGSARLEVELPVVGTNNTRKTSLYVLDTDYEDYSLVYSCSNMNDFERSIGVWKLSRERAMSPEATTAINGLIQQRQELHEPYFIQVHQDEDCEEPSAGVLVRSSIVVMVICALWQILS